MGSRRASKLRRIAVALACLAPACAHAPPAPAPPPPADARDQPLPSPAAAGARDQPPPLTRDEIELGMARAMPRMRFCPDYPPGSAAPHMQVDVAPSGRVTQVRSLGPVTGTPADSCRQQAVRLLVFRANPGTTFDYVFPID